MKLEDNNLSIIPGDQLFFKEGTPKIIAHDARKTQYEVETNKLKRIILKDAREPLTLQERAAIIQVEIEQLLTETLSTPIYILPLVFSASTERGHERKYPTPNLSWQELGQMDQGGVVLDRIVEAIFEKQ